MTNSRALLGLWRWMLPVPPALWRRQVAANARQTRASLGFMSPQHHQIRNYVVRELPRAGRPLSPAAIAESVGLPLDTVNAILDDLEKHLTFLFRNAAGAVTWAYPVTVDETPHRMVLSTGEQLYAA